MPRFTLLMPEAQEVEAFADAGHTDITYAVPCIPARLPRLQAVRDKHPSLTLRLLLDSSEGVAKCGEHVEDGAAPWPVFLKVDCGYSRAGVSPITTPTKALQVARDIHKSPQFTLFGLYAHSGNAYNCKGGKPEAAQVAHSEAEVISDFAQALASEGISVDAVGVGSTPSAAACTALPSSITEMHPGNFLFYDLQQVDSGSCSLGDIACGVLTSIIGVYPERNEVLIDAGGTAMHKDPGGVEGWGRVHGHADLSLLRMSQECTVVGVQPALKASPGKPLAERFRLGDKLFVLPNHSCMTACQHEVYHVTKQPTDAQVLTQWEPCKFW